ncbi:MAG TPA: glycosyltransferase family 39 protein [Ktedonobacterales bacterium]|nr:glycosyltransferase family 39 protein [Ktedonobacterales bacterium]
MLLSATRPARLNGALAALLRTAAPSREPMERGDWIYLASLFALTRVLIVFIGLLGTALVPELALPNSFALHPLHPGDDIWSRLFDHFDAGWYLGISHSYTLPGSGPDWLREWMFFPLYPWVLRPVALVLGLLRVAGNVDAVAGVLVSNTALFIALVYLYRLTRGELSTRAARRAVTYLLIFPGSFYFSADYPESLYLLCSVAAFYYARHRKWALAGLAAALALLTRPQGLLLVVPLLIELVAWLRAEGLLGRRALRGLWLGLPLVSLAGYALYSHAKTGYWLAFEASATQVWGHRVTPPVYPLIRYLLAPDLGSATQYDLTSVNFAVTVLFLVVAVLAWRRLPVAYSIWLLICVLFPLSSLGHNMTSMVRYAAIAFPAFMALAAWTTGERWTPKGTATDRATPLALDLRDRLVLIPSLLLLPFFVVMFVNGILAAV